MHHCFTALEVFYAEKWWTAGRYTGPHVCNAQGAEQAQLPERFQVKRLHGAEAPQDVYISRQIDVDSWMLEDKVPIRTYLSSCMLGFPGNAKECLVNYVIGQSLRTSALLLTPLLMRHRFYQLHCQ